MRFKIILAVLCVAAVVGAWMLLSMNVAEAPEGEPTPMADGGASRSILSFDGAPSGDAVSIDTKDKTTNSRWRKGRRLEGVVVRHEPEVPYTAAQQVVSDELWKALDGNDRESVYRIASEAVKSDNPELRREGIEALGWFGKDAIPDLLACMADPDEDVAEVAVDNWEQALSQIPSTRERMETAMIALKVLTNEDALDAIGAQFANAANDRIDSEDDEEKAMAKRVEAVQMLVDIIEDEKAKKPNVDQAKELYSDISGHDWVSIEEAEKYLSDPDNYDPDDEEYVSSSSSSGSHGGASAKSTIESDHAVVPDEPIDLEIGDVGDDAVPDGDGGDDAAPQEEEESEPPEEDAGEDDEEEDEEPPPAGEQPADYQP